MSSIVFDLNTSQSKNYIFNVTASQTAFHFNYTLWAYATYQGRVSQNNTVAQIIGPSIAIIRENPPLFTSPNTNTTVTLSINNSAQAEETARNLNVTEMVPSAWIVNVSSITPGATTWQSGGIFYIQWSLPDLIVGNFTNVSYGVRSPVKYLEYNFESNATYLDDYGTLLNSHEYHEVNVVAAINFSAGTFIVPTDDKQDGNSTQNGYPRVLVAYGFLYNITTNIPTSWAVQAVDEYFTANTTNVWNGTSYIDEAFGGGPFIISNLNPTQRDQVIQTAAYYNITLHNSTNPFDIQKGLILSPPRIAYYVPTGDPSLYNYGREDLILNNSLIEFTYLDKFDVIGGQLENYDALVVPSGSLQGTGVMENAVIDEMYDWVVAGGNLWIVDEAAYEMVKYKGILSLTTEHFVRGGLGNLTTGNNLTITQAHLVTQTYGQVIGYPGWYDVILGTEFARTTLATLEGGGAGFDHRQGRFR